MDGGHECLLDVKLVMDGLDSTLGDAVDGVVLVLVGHVVGGGRSRVDGAELDVVILRHDTGDETSDTSKSVDTHASGHRHGGSIGGGFEGGAGERVRRGGASGEKSECGGELHVEMRYGYQ